MGILQEQATALELEIIEIDERLEEERVAYEAKVKSLKEERSVKNRVLKAVTKGAELLATTDATTDISE